MKHSCLKLLSLILTVLLSQAPTSAISQEVNYSSFDVSPFDGRHQNRGNWLGSWILFKNVKIDGVKAKKSKIGFAIGGDFPNKPSNQFEFSGIRTFSNMPKSLGDQRYGDGNSFFLNGANGDGWAGDAANVSLKVARRLSGEDATIFKAFCGLMTDDAFIKRVLSRLANMSPNYFGRSYVDNKFNKYWSNAQRVNQLIDVANECNRGLKNTGPEKVKFTLSKTPKLCGVETRGFLLNSRTFKSIQSDLKLLGHYNGKIDGLFGAGSCKSLAAYNSSIGKTVLTYYTKFYINSLRERAKSVSTVIPQKSKETESEAAILAAAKKEAAEIIEAAKKEAALIEAAKKEVAAIVEAAKKEANVTNELSASNILLADNISDEAAISPSTVIVEEKELKENIFQIEKLTELQEIALKADTFLMEYTKDQAGKLMRYKLRLTVKGSEIDTSLVSKSIFGFENSSSIDISMSIGSSQAALDFIIDEENTKINLHFSDDASVNKDFASNIPELILDASEISGAFLVRIIDDGSNNIQSGDFAQILEKLDPKDVALVGAFCSVIQSISADKNTFIKSVTQNIPDESKDGFSSSPLVSDGVINIINSHATACVGELEKVNNTKASFDIPNLFDFDETGETLLENSTENILEKSRAELKIKEIAEQKRLAKQYAEEKRLAEEQRKKNKQRRLEEKRIADLAKVEKKKKEKEKLLAEKALLEKQLGKYPKMIGGKKLWISAEEFKKSGTSCAKFYNNESGMFVAKAFNSESTKILIYPGGKNEFKNSVKDENHTLRGGNKITSVENIIEFLNILKIGSSVQKTTYRISRDGNKITPISGQCIGCTGGVKIAFDRIIEKKSPVYWCFNDL